MEKTLTMITRNLHWTLGPIHSQAWETKFPELAGDNKTMISVDDTSAKAPRF